MTAATRRLLPAYLLLTAGGVALGSAVMQYADQGTVAWSRLLSAGLLVLFAAGYSKYAGRRATIPTRAGVPDRSA